jgi:TRAP-type mannitol/chloroaromatic compound transport system permease small subunit
MFVQGIYQGAYMSEHSFRTKINVALDWLVDAAGKVAAFLVLIITVMVALDVAARFVLGAGTKWSIEFTAYFLVGIVFFGLAFALKEGAHISIDIISKRLPQKVQKWLEVINSFFFLVYSLFLGYLSWETVITSISFGTTSRTAVDIIVWPFQLFIPIGLAITSLLLIRIILHNIKVAILQEEGRDSK